MKNTDIRTQLRKYIDSFCGIPADQARATHSVSGIKAGFDIFRYDDVPFEGASTLCTVGISDVQLHHSDRSMIRNELLFTLHTEYLSDELYNLMFAVGTMLLEEKEGVVPGQLMELEEPIIDGSSMEALFFYSPIYFPEEMYIYKKTDPPVAFVWAIPVTRQEMMYIEDKGHESFSDLLEDADPDMTDLFRSSVV